MVNVSQGTMKIIRIKLFNHMQSLPIQYFDSHSHGDIMSIYTNDTDTLRQFLSQSVPQLFNSIITIVSIFVAMITLNIPLTIITLVMVAIMLVVAKNAAALSSKYFNQQQNNLGKLNGFIEEMISGQKVVKVFCYEKRSLARFRSVNEELKESSQKANIYGNILMPIIIQIGNVSYVICAVIGSILILNGYGGLSVGMLVSFLTLNKNFNQPCEIRAYIKAMIENGNEEATPEWIEWAFKKADWYDPTKDVEDEYLGKRDHGKNKDEKDLDKIPVKSSWYW